MPFLGQISALKTAFWLLGPNFPRTKFAPFLHYSLFQISRLPPEANTSLQEKSRIQAIEKLSLEVLNLNQTLFLHILVLLDRMEITLKESSIFAEKAPPSLPVLIQEDDMIEELTRSFENTCTLVSPDQEFVYDCVNLGLGQKYLRAKLDFQAANVWMERFQLILTRDLSQFFHKKIQIPVTSQKFYIGMGITGIEPGFGHHSVRDQLQFTMGGQYLADESLEKVAPFNFFSDLPDDKNILETAKKAEALGMFMAHFFEKKEITMLIIMLNLLSDSGDSAIENMYHCLYKLLLKRLLYYKEFKFCHRNPEKAIHLLLAKTEEFSMLHHAMVELTREWNEKNSNQMSIIPA